MSQLAHIKLPVIIEHPENDSQCYGIRIPCLPNCFSHGDSVSNALINMVEALELHLSTDLSAVLNPFIKTPPLTAKERVHYLNLVVPVSRAAVVADKPVGVPADVMELLSSLFNAAGVLHTSSQIADYNEIQKKYAPNAECNAHLLDVPDLTPEPELAMTAIVRESCNTQGLHLTPDARKLLVKEMCQVAKRLGWTFTKEIPE